MNPPTKKMQKDVCPGCGWAGNWDGAVCPECGGVTFSYMDLYLQEHPAGTVIADPNWKYANWTDAKNGAAKAHYDLSPAEQIGMIPVDKWTHKDSILLLWANWAKLEDAFVVAHMWGFEEQVSGLPWVKTTPNTGLIRTGVGFWWQGASEPLLAFRKGSPKNKRKETKQVKGLLCGSEMQFYAPIKDHSSKPLTIYDYAMDRCPGPHLELFARNQIRNWICLGHDTGWELTTEGIKPYEEETDAEDQH